MADIEEILDYILPADDNPTTTAPFPLSSSVSPFPSSSSLSSSPSSDQSSTSFVAEGGLDPDSEDRHQLLKESTKVKRILYVNAALLQQSSKEVAKQLTIITRSATNSANFLYDCVKDGFEALELLYKNSYHAMIIYNDLPNMSGLETIRIAQHIDQLATLAIILIGVPEEPLEEEDRQTISRIYYNSPSQRFLGADFLDAVASFTKE
mmetsp:Transcript_8254/g.10701  ORF Transcript_8254/g.10701 Transcript_8254/m.10701 type:complete len:208 (-) Transcript_8254:99-722(-)